MTKDERVLSFQKLEKLVKERKINYFQLAKSLSMTPVVFSDWKAGRSMPKTDKLLDISRFFGVDIGYFFE